MKKLFLLLLWPTITTAQDSIRVDTVYDDGVHWVVVEKNLRTGKRKRVHGHTCVNVTIVIPPKRKELKPAEVKRGEN